MTNDDFDAAVAEAVKLEHADQKLAALVRLRRSVLKERRLLRALTVLSILLGCGAIMLGIQARMALDEFKVSRAEARVTSCESYNADTVDKVNGILRSIAEGSRDPEAAAVVVDPLMLDHRLCTDDGINAYFDGDPTTDPFVKE